MNPHRKKFYEQLEKYIKDHSKGKQEYVCLTKERCDRALAASKLGKGEKCEDGASFKFWCTKSFMVVKVGSKEGLHCKKTSCPVVPKEDLFDVLTVCHERVGHSGKHKTWDEVRHNYSWIKYGVVGLFLQTCTTCAVSRHMKTTPPGKPTINLGFLTRLQVDLINMTSHPDDKYRWILHVQDHFSKFSWAAPLTSQKPAEVAKNLTSIFCQFGPPNILQSDSSREFIADVIKELALQWNGLVIIRGRIRHRQTQECVKRGNDQLQTKLIKWMEDNNRSWSNGLKFVVFIMNTSTSSITGKTPYELVFGQAPRASNETIEQLAVDGLVDEDNLLKNFMDDQLDSSSEQLVCLPDMIKDSPNNYQSEAFSSMNKIRKKCMLLFEGNAVAVGIPMPDQKTLNGKAIDNKTFMVLKILTVLDDDFVHENSNSPDEILATGQYVTWNRESMVGVETDETSRKRARVESEEEFL